MIEGVPWLEVAKGELSVRLSRCATVPNAAAIALKEEAKAHPLVQAVFDAFPTAKIVNIKTPEEIAQEAQIEALPEVEDEWDPFEED